MKKRNFIWIMAFCLMVVPGYSVCADEVDDRIAEIEAQIGELQSELQNLKAQKAQESGAGTQYEDIEILAEYTLSDGIGWYTRHFMVIKNNSDQTIDVSTSSLAYGENGTLVGVDDAELDALGAGCVSILYEAIETDQTIAYYETEINTSPSEYYESVIQDLSFVQNVLNDGAVFQVTNNGTDAAEFVEGYALFFLGDDLIGYESTYFTDDDSEIKPGKTVSKQMTSYEDFDRIEFYLTGRK